MQDDRSLGSRIDFAVFPMLQGGPHVHQIAGVATQLREVASPSFREYATRVISNSRALAEALIRRGHTLATGGKHLCARRHTLSVARLCERVSSVPHVNLMMVCT